MSFSDNMRSGGFRQYLSTASTATTFASSLGGATGIGKLLTKAQAAALTIFPLNRCLTARIAFYGRTADGATGYFRVWGIQRIVTAAGVPDEAVVMAIPLGGGTITLGTSVGQATSTTVTDSDRFADTIVWEASLAGAPTANYGVNGPLASLETALNEGTSVAYDADTPANDIAMLVLPNMGRFSGLVVDMNVNAAGTDLTQMNCLIATDDI
jgi:hypothetical protein